MKIFGLQVPFTKTYVGASDGSALVPLRYSSGLLGFIRESFPGAWQRNVIADDRQTLLACAPVYACISRIATDIAKLRVRLVEQVGGIWNEVDRNSPFWPVLRKPNSYQNRIQFMVAWITSKLMFGNTYVLKVRDQRSIVTEMHVLDPRRVTPLVTTEGDVYYQLGRDDLAGVGAVKGTVPASEIIHDRGVTLWHPLVGVSPLYACAAAGTQANRIQANSARFFENMSRPSGVLSGPGVINDVTADRLKKGFEENFSAGNLGRLAVLGDGLVYQPMTIPAEQAQLIEQLKWTGEDIARAFGVPGYKIGVGPIPTNNNVEALNQQYYDGCLQIHLESIELCLDEGLGLTAVQERVYGTEFDLDGLLRMDSATLAESLGKLIGAAIMKPDEARAKLNLPPVTGGDTPYLQQQNYSLAALAKRDALDDPFGKATTTAAPVVAEPAKSIDDERFTKLMAMIEAQGAGIAELSKSVADKVGDGEVAGLASELVLRFMNEE
jgi:HK97 family phage portal protein